MAGSKPPKLNRDSAKLNQENTGKHERGGVAINQILMMRLPMAKRHLKHWQSEGENNAWIHDSDRQ
jgi:hypothetical protein